MTDHLTMAREALSNLCRAVEMYGEGNATITHVETMAFEGRAALNATPHPSAGAPSREAIARIIERHVRQNTWTDQHGYQQMGLGLSGVREAADQIRALYATPPSEPLGELGSVGMKPSREGEAGGGAEERVEWHRDQNLLYTLEQDGWYRGKPVMVNRLMVKVERSHSVPAEEVDALADRLHALLSAASVAPEARATAQSRLSAEGAQHVGEANGKPTGPNPPTLSAMGEGWRPIEEAPQQERVWVGRYDLLGWFADAVYRPSVGWCYAHDRAGPEAHLCHEPTHFMRQPYAPPAPLAEGGEG